jgi:hypothetical protein
MLPRLAALLCTAVALGGCSFPRLDYMFAKKPQGAVAVLRLDSDPPGAEAQASFGLSCHTPCSLPLGGDGEFVVVFVQAGYLPVTVPISVQVPQDARPDSEFALSPAPRIVPNPVFARLVRAPGYRETATRPQAPQSPVTSDEDDAK